MPDVFARGMPQGLLAALWLPHGASSFSPQVQFLWDLFFGIAVFFTVLITVLTLYFAIHYRRRPGRREPDPAPNHNMPLEITWTVIPLIIVMVIFALGFKYYMNMNTPPAGAYNIAVHAQKMELDIRLSQRSRHQQALSSIE